MGPVAIGGQDAFVGGDAATLLIALLFVMLAAPAVAGNFLATFKEFPPSQRPASFSIDQIVEKMQRSFDAVAK